MGARVKFDQTKWRLERERFRLTDSAPPHPEPDLSLRSAITRFFTKLDSQSGSAVQQIQSKWKIMAGETIANHSCPARLIDNVLYIDVDSSAWLAEITRFHSDDILRKIHKEFAPDTVRGMRFQVNPSQAGQS